ncbi:hypothetical protein [Bacillus cereus]|uniref:Uncharacterized protein n=1 Tax=Bacillus cereus HuA3-9 TaxID=1053205 RepID=R8CIE8_BACCE|nr:hypothetical protein [Bacillus cereus]EOO11362.1 hypothetical protein IGA_05625 [Bacillus cereus HuA3-9]
MRKIEPMTITEEQAEWLQQYLEKPPKLNPKLKVKLTKFMKRRRNQSGETGDIR